MTKNQKQTLMTLFQANAYPSEKEICEFARLLSTSKGRIKDWFSRMRLMKPAERMLHVPQGEYCSATHTL